VVKNVSQALVLLPHLVSWVIAAYLVFAFLGYNGFINNSILAPLGINNIAWYTIPKYWPVIITLVNLWHNVGYWCIMYYATIVGIDPTYYEAADLDGASHWQKIIYITIPFLKVVTITIVLLSLGRIFYSDFGLFYQIPMNSGALFPTTNVIDTYVYRGLLVEGNISMSSAACLYQSIVGFIVILIANGVVRKIDRDSAFY
jgi:putative aldouronate transport system permease protein